MFEKTGQFYRVLFDHRIPNQWFLSEPRTAQGEVIDGWRFTAGLPYRGPIPNRVPVYKEGVELAFNLAALEMPVVSSEVATTLQKAAGSEIELFPVAVPAAKGSYAILNALVKVECLDERRSEATKWQPADGRPDKIGQYRQVISLAIEADRTAGHNIFRIQGWEIALIVSSKIKLALEKHGQLGVIFQATD